MKLLVCGDTHGDRRALELLLEAFGRHSPDLFAHTGDYYRDYLWLQQQTGVNGYGVPGNCDYGVMEDDELLFELEGLQFWLVHGHQHRVKRGPERLAKAARKKKVDVLLFGHTHATFVEKRDKLLMVNPGSLYWPRGGSDPSYAVITLSPGNAQAEIIIVE